MNRLQNEVNRVFGRRQNGEREFTGVGYPPLNMWEDDGHYFVEAELPGLAMEDLEILVTSDNQLSIAGERKQPATKNGSWHRQERSYGSFKRLTELPGPIDSEQVTATLTNGVLQVTLPKRVEAKARRIVVKTVSS